MRQQSPCASAAEPVDPRVTLCNKRITTASDGRGPGSPQLQKAGGRNEDPAQPGPVLK